MAKQAIFEQEPGFVKTTKREQFLPFFTPSLGEEEINEVVDSLRSGWVTTGPKTKQFEAEFAEYVGAKYAVAVNSCTAGMHIALAAHGIQAGDEVITTPLTFCATIEAIEYMGATPVLVDIDPITRNLDVNQLEKAITPRTRAVIPVHFAGMACEMDAIMELASRHNLFVLEDAAHAAGTLYKGRKIGSIGHATAFSFYANKNMTTAEGGMVTTDSEELADKMRILSLHGISRDAWKRYTAAGSWYYEVLELGFKYNMTDVAASMGLWQLRKLDLMNRMRQQIALSYTDALSSIPEIETPAFDEREQSFHSWHLYVIGLKLDQLSIDRAQFIQALNAENIGTSVHFIPIHYHPHYQEKFAFKRGDYPLAEAHFERSISLPIYPTLTKQDIDDVTGAIARIVEAHRL